MRLSDIERAQLSAKATVLRETGDEFVKQSHVIEKILDRDRHANDNVPWPVEYWKQS